MIKNNWMNPTDTALLESSSKDPLDPRLRESVQTATLDSLQNLEMSSSGSDTPMSFHLLGYPDDEGIRLNGGRVGAASAPTEIRKILYKMTPHLQSQQTLRLNDLGNLNIQSLPLLERHQRGRQIIKKINQHSQRWISIGGGHDYGYSDACGFLDVFKNEALILNIDSHLDVRPYSGTPHSGTPFYRMLSEFSKQVSFYELGIQNHCNSRHHLAWAQEHHTEIVFQNELNSEAAFENLVQRLPTDQKLKVFLSVDIDGFSNSDAPGCSQSWASGFPLTLFFKLLHHLQTHFDVRGLGVYEVSPPLDFDHKTSKLAALLIHHFLYGFSKYENH